MWPFSEIKSVHCDFHDCDITVYPVNEQSKFVDDNSSDIVFFKDSGLKRYVEGKCDRNCPTIKELLNE